MYQRGGIGKILGGKVMRVLKESGSLDPREMSKGKDLILQVQTCCLQHFTFASGDSKRW